MTQVTKFLQPLVIFILIAFIAIDRINENPPEEQSGEMRDRPSLPAEDESESLESRSHTDAKAKEKRKKFSNRASPIPREDWPKIDSKECIVQDKDDLDDFQHRAPYALIVGAMKAGTSSLNNYLQEHSNVMTTKMKELHFYDFRFDNFTTTKGILRSDARKEYRKTYKRNIDLPMLKRNDGKIALDDSPRYLFWSERVPQRVLCVSPWVKILAILRNPVDRAFSQYNMFLNHPGKVQKKLAFTFEEWIENDIEDLKATGVLQNKIPLAKFRNSPQEEAAWKAYTRLGSHAPIGRGLYALQLRQWYQAFDEAGKSLDDIMVIQSELMKEEPTLVYSDILEFLGLPLEPLKDTAGSLIGKYKISLEPETRKMMEDLYEPYNQELYELLGKDWDGVWDP